MATTRRAASPAGAPGPHDQQHAHQTLQRHQPPLAQQPLEERGREQDRAAQRPGHRQGRQQHARVAGGCPLQEKQRGEFEDSELLWEFG